MHVAITDCLLENTPEHWLWTGSSSLEPGPEGPSPVHVAGLPQSIPAVSAVHAVDQILYLYLTCGKRVNNKAKYKSL